MPIDPVQLSMSPALLTGDASQTVVALAVTGDAEELRALDRVRWSTGHREQDFHEFRQLGDTALLSYVHSDARDEFRTVRVSWGGPKSGSTEIILPKKGGREVVRRTLREPEQGFAEPGYSIALSYSSVDCAFVSDVYGALELESFERPIFFDRKREHNMPSAGGSDHFARVFDAGCQLRVAFLTDLYLQSRGCNWEWRPIKARITAPDESSDWVMLFGFTGRLDDSTIDGVHLGTDVIRWIGEAMSAEEVAKQIAGRYRQLLEDAR